MTDVSQVAAQINLATARPDHESNREASWFEAMAEAWGEALDAQATSITDKAAELDAGNDSPADVTMLTAESLRMQFMSNSAHTSISAMGSALETMARKQ